MEKDRYGDRHEIRAEGAMALPIMLTVLAVGTAVLFAFLVVRAAQDPQAVVRGRRGRAHSIWLDLIVCGPVLIGLVCGTVRAFRDAAYFRRSPYLVFTRTQLTAASRTEIRTCDLRRCSCAAIRKVRRRKRLDCFLDLMDPDGHMVCRIDLDPLRPRERDDAVRAARHYIACLREEKAPAETAPPRPGT